MIDIIYLGSPEFARAVLEILHKSGLFAIKAVVSNESKKVGRKGVLTPTPVACYALDNDLKLIQTEKITDEFCEEIRGLKPQFCVVVAFGKILPEKFINISTAINLHGSILPKYRGASPMQSMILNDEKEMGLSIIKIEKALDSGEILGEYKFTKEGFLDIDELSEILIKEGSAKLIEIMQNYPSIIPQTQDNNKASYCGKIGKEDGLINFDNAKNIYLKSLAFKHWPQIFTKDYKIFDIDLVEETSTNTAGVVLKIDKNSITIGCNKGSLSIKYIQANSKNKIEARQFLANKGLKVGDLLPL